MHATLVGKSSSHVERSPLIHQGSTSQESILLSVPVPDKRACFDHDFDDVLGENRQCRLVRTSSYYQEGAAVICWLPWLYSYFVACLQDPSLSPFASNPLTASWALNVVNVFSAQL